jgi:hypothetical protein
MIAGQRSTSYMILEVEPVLVGRWALVSAPRMARLSAD